MADQTVKRLVGVLHDVLVKLESFIFPVDFMILDSEVDFKDPVILGRPFLYTVCVLVDMENRHMKFWLNNEESTLNICRSIKQSGEIQTVSSITYKVESVSKMKIEERLGFEALEAVIINFISDGIREYDSLVAALERNEY